MISNVLLIAGMIFGFGFVVFIHELGHFLAAKYVRIRVEQFAVGFGNAIFAWRKGLGIRRGTTTPEYHNRIREHLKIDDPEKELSGQQIEKGSNELGLGETEYRLNWVPLGGYVKMVGQDDMDPNNISSDPRSFTQKSISARVLVISAGVIFNVIFAALLSIVLFLFIGFKVPPAIVGSVLFNSPAQQAGIQPGDRIISISGWDIPDFAKMPLVTALVDPDVPARVHVRHADGKEEIVDVMPRTSKAKAAPFLTLGVTPPFELRGLDPKSVVKKEDIAKLDPKVDLMPGDVVVAVNGKAVADTREFTILLDELQKSDGTAVTMSVKDLEGKTRELKVEPAFGAAFDDAELNIGGLRIRPVVKIVEDKSPVKDIVKPGDIIVGMWVKNERVDGPGLDAIRQNNFKAGEEDLEVSYEIIQDGKFVKTKPVVPNFKTSTGNKGMGIGMDLETDRPVIASALPGTSAEKAGAKAGLLIKKVNGTDVSNWYAVRLAMTQAAGGKVALDCVALSPETDQPVDGSEKTISWTFSPEEWKDLKNVRIEPGGKLIFMSQFFVRKTSNPLTAVKWGVQETRDSILQVYISLKRVFINRNVSPKHLMGPVGIAQVGVSISTKGLDWLFWFLAMISANLAVVNFLPIPVMDGGAFWILMAEKVTGKPLHPWILDWLQRIGLTIILAIFLFATFNDIMRFF